METEEKKIGLVVHGGADMIARSKMTPELERDLSDALTVPGENSSFDLSRGTAS